MTPVDIRAQQAREHHRAAQADEAGAARHRAQRDDVVRRLRAEGWTYAALAQAVGCSQQMIAVIITGDPRKRG